MQRRRESLANPESIITSVKNDKRSRKSTSFRTSKFVRGSIRNLFRLVFCHPKKKKRKSKDIELPEGINLLPRVTKSIEHKICLVVDLDETLVHSSFKPSKDADFVVPVVIEYHTHKVYVRKRPFVDEFIDFIGPLFECVLFTASLSKYADPVVNLLDHKGYFRTRLFRESCLYRKGYYTKDLSLLGRDLSKIIIVDNSPNSYALQKQNAIPIKTWINDNSDTELLKMIPLLSYLATCDNVLNYLPKFVNDLQVNFELVPNNNSITANNNVDSRIVSALCHEDPHLRSFTTRSEGKDLNSFKCLFIKQIKLQSQDFFVGVSESLPNVAQSFFSRPFKIITISMNKLIGLQRTGNHFNRMNRPMLTSNEDSIEDDVDSLPVQTF